MKHSCGAWADCDLTRSGVRLGVNKRHLIPGPYRVRPRWLLIHRLYISLVLIGGMYLHYIYH